MFIPLTLQTKNDDVFCLVRVLLCPPWKWKGESLMRWSDCYPALLSAGHRAGRSALLAMLLASAGAPGRCVDVSSDQQKAYRNFSSAVKPENLAATINTLVGYGSRVSGYPGDRAAADYVLSQFRALGLDNIKEDRFRVTVPYDAGVDDPEKGAFAQVQTAGATASSPTPRLHMYPLWPNLVRTPTLPANGLTAPLIYVGDGRLNHFNGKDVDGSIVMVDFNCGEEWLNAPRLGARAC